ncbi:unnamed protein product [Arabidopsis thaliana]|uniref:Uncharacterized protein n=1 Tax=Arabidopsis thaliana TaxID=3702 RepID=A0A654FLX4_ARATH|nr:unnamed protein product [Arabidopsis thaliana]
MKSVALAFHSQSRPSLTRTLAPLFILSSFQLVPAINTPSDDEGVITTDDDDSDTDRHWEDWEEYQLIEDMKKQQVNDSDTSSSSDEDDVKSGKEKLGEQATRSLSTLGVLGS